MNKVQKLLLLLWTCSQIVHSVENSIMELINAEHVEQLILSQLQPANSTQTPIPDILHNSLTDDETPDIYENSVTKRNRKGHKSSLPDISSVFMDLSRPDKILKSVDNGMLVTKKSYIRKDWCKTEAIIQKVREEGCQPKNVVNRFCYGQCNSFYIPKNISTKKGKRKRTDDLEEVVAFRSCGVCKPKKTALVQVTLNCPGSVPPTRRRVINKVKQCQCMAQNTYR